MTGTVVCTVCSRHKRTDPIPLAAHERYTGTHIEMVRAIAKKQKLPLFFLSAKEGLIRAEAHIYHYDCALELHMRDALVSKVRWQIEDFGIERIHFYCKPTPSWQMYNNVLCHAAVFQTHIDYFELDENA